MPGRARKTSRVCYRGARMDDQRKPRVIEANIDAHASPAQAGNVDRQTIRFTYAKAAAMRTVHADLAVGGTTPTAHISMAFLSERQAIPAEQVFEIVGGRLGRQLNDARIGNQGIERIVESEVIMTVDAAARFHDWLGRQIETARAQISKHA